MALGAVPQDVGRMVFGDSLWIVAVGIVVGVAASLGVTRFLSGFLFGTSTHPVSFIAVAILVGAVAVVATLIPVRRAIASCGRCVTRSRLTRPLPQRNRRSEARMTARQ